MYEKKFPGSSENVYQKLREKILHLELPPLSSVSEIETAAEYEVSRTPVRDAFKMLEAEGLLEVRPHIGTFVTQIDLEMVSDILYMREKLDAAVLTELSEKFSESDKKEVMEKLDKQKRLLESDMDIDELSRAFILEDNEFHYMLYEKAGRSNVHLMFSFMNAQYERFRTLLNLCGKDNLERLYKDHVILVECIEHGNIVELNGLISKHIYEGFRQCEAVKKRYPEYFKKEKEKL